MIAVVVYVLSMLTSAFCAALPSADLSLVRAALALVAVSLLLDGLVGDAV